MEHRHLNHSDFTLAAIDDVIERGRWEDWLDLRAALLRDPAVRQGVERICAARCDDEAAFRHRFWRNYVQAAA